MMMRFVETNILIASAQEFHDKHIPCLELVASMGPATSGTSAHCLAEFYSVTTRIPPGIRLQAAEAQRFIESFKQRFTLVGLDAEETVEEVLSCGRRGITGGRLYDCLILASARKAQATEIYTLNVRHFRQLAPDLAPIIREP